MEFRINPELDIPIYQQLVDTVRSAIQRGELASGAQLPSVQEMTRELGIARGTVKRAYDELEHAGMIEKAQGRGTFVCYRPANAGSRKEQAIAAIDTMLDQLEGMGFGAAEIKIFLELKLREWSEQEAHVKIAVVECNPENLSYMSEQLRHISGVDLYAYMLDSIRQYPYKLNEEFDLIVTTSAHADYLTSVVSYEKKVVRVALRPSARCLSRIIRLSAGAKVGVIGYSERFAGLIYTTCGTYAEEIDLHKPLSAASDTDAERYLRSLQVVLVPSLYKKYLSAGTIEALNRFSGEIIECDYEMDEGSLIYLENKIKRILNEKTI